MFVIHNHTTGDGEGGGGDGGGDGGGLGGGELGSFVEDMMYLNDSVEVVRSGLDLRGNKKVIDNCVDEDVTTH